MRESTRRPAGVAPPIPNLIPRADTRRACSSCGVPIDQAAARRVRCDPCASWERMARTFRGPALVLP